MTTVTKSLIGASSARVKNWNAINWRAFEARVQRLQSRIAKAISKANKQKPDSRVIMSLREVRAV